jgi:predicted membrane chloride channel (bestrophin family)
MEGILEMLWNLAPRLLVCLLFTVAAVFLIVWLVHDESARSRALLCAVLVGIITGITWEVYARYKKSRRP